MTKAGRNKNHARGYDNEENYHIISMERTSCFSATIRETRKADVLPELPLLCNIDI